MPTAQQFHLPVSESQAVLLPSGNPASNLFLFSRRIANVIVPPTNADPTITLEVFVNNEWISTGITKTGGSNSQVWDASEFTAIAALMPSALSFRFAVSANQAANRIFLVYEMD